MCCEGGGKIAGEGADIRPRPADDLKLILIGRGLRKQTEGIHRHIARRKGKVRAAACEVVAAPAAHREGAVLGRDLRDLAHKGGKRLLDLRRSRHRSAADDLPFPIERFRRRAEGEAGDVRLFLGEKVVKQPRCVAHADGQDAAGERVERAHVPARHAGEPFDLVYRLRRAHALGLEEVEKARHCGSRCATA